MTQLKYNVSMIEKAVYTINANYNKQVKKIRIHPIIYKEIMNNIDPFSSHNNNFLDKKANYFLSTSTEITQDADGVELYF